MVADDFTRLKERHRASRETWPQDLNLRVHRALSWLQRAEQAGDDLDIRFMCLWVGFNAAYASSELKEEGHTEKSVFRHFLHALLRLDTDKQLEALLWQQFPQAIRVLLDNPYVYQPFWDARQLAAGLSEAAIDERWRPAFEAEKRRVNEALTRNDTLTILATVLSRLYTLRNQILHGGATWNSQVNRDQLRDGVRILGSILPCVITVMMDHPEAGWSSPMYPVVGS